MRPGAISYRFSSRPVSTGPLQELVDRIPENRFSAIVGNHGTGKSTLIRSLAPLLSNRFDTIGEVLLCAREPKTNRWCHHNQTRDQVTREQSRIKSGGLLIIDGLEQLSFPAILVIGIRAKRRGQQVLATSHHPILGFKTLHRTTLSAELVQELTEQLIDGIPSDQKRLVMNEVQRRMASETVNLRDLWFDCYDLVCR
ncbi:hypothetical protein CA13_47820 [Planctomycetes bacterium CA13]|uniref:AAA+ ATPase domain-containing protein n=1 Tax=Novipirellula herctigrandis TaxID=2527986 RepID=A0A5C5Z888_9BACT|nr:hypothetical protein CA13_47820 [Planctomycetes bacterium CA13]